MQNFKGESEPGASTGCFRDAGTKVTGLAGLAKRNEESFNKEAGEGLFLSKYSLDTMCSV